MKSFDKVVKNTVNSLYMKKWAAVKGWTKQEAAYKVVEFLTCGEQISVNEFMARQ